MGCNKCPWLELHKANSGNKDLFCTSLSAPVMLKISPLTEVKPFPFPNGWLHDLCPLKGSPEDRKKHENPAPVGGYKTYHPDNRGKDAC